MLLPVQPTAQFAREYGVQSKEARKYIFGSLVDMVHVGVDSALGEQGMYLCSLDRLEFVSLLSRMLTLDPRQRIHPRQALQMPFITMHHLAAHTHTSIVWEWIQSMQVCRHPPTTPPQPSIGSSLLAQGCCGHLHLLPGAVMQPPPPNQIIAGSHLVCVCVYVCVCVRV